MLARLSLALACSEKKVPGSLNVDFTSKESSISSDPMNNRKGMSSWPGSTDAANINTCAIRPENLTTPFQ